MMKQDETVSAEKKQISEGTMVYGSDGEQWGLVAAVGANYLTIAEGLIGQREWYLAIRFVARSDLERVVLTVPLAEAQARAYREEPADEPTLTGEGEAIPEEERQAVGLPTPPRDNWGLDRRPPQGKR